MKINVNKDMLPVIRIVSVSALPRIFSAFSWLFSPKVIEIRDAEPAPINKPNAISRIIKGKVSARPDMANGPTPCPINILSTILYKDMTTIPTIEGRE
ncbi:hypothetical protein SDC9_120813 [bioreactor metagenome]|uniref:Uncharacterized protein n=1 Tax=bioreactor metagenome TaxID=1076179 RepID=A0A645CA97_9ZZZZ